MRRNQRREIVQLEESDWTRPVKARSVRGSVALLAAAAALTAAPLIYVVWTAPIRDGIDGVDNIHTGLEQVHRCVSPKVPPQLKTPECRRISASMTTTTTATGH